MAAPVTLCPVHGGGTYRAAPLVCPYSEPRQAAGIPYKRYRIGPELITCGLPEKDGQVAARLR